MKFKTCTKCKEEKEATLEYFPPYKKCLDGLLSWCRVCKRKQNKIATKNWEQRNKEKRDTYLTKYRQDNKDKRREQTKQWLKDNPIARKAKNKRRKDNRLIKYKQATLNNSNVKKSLSKIYKECPKGYEIHHIVPISENKETICGLNVPWNLQYLTKEEHRLIHAK